MRPNNNFLQQRMMKATLAIIVRMREPRVQRDSARLKRLPNSSEERGMLRDCECVNGF